MAGSTSRRDMLALAAGSVAAAAMPTGAASALTGEQRPNPNTAPAVTTDENTASPARWGRTHEGQRCADLGNGQYRNPILAGAHADPSILKDGDDYYLALSSFEADPGLLIWHSRDLINWQPFTNALPAPLGSVFAVDLIKHDGRYFIYIPFIPTNWSTELNEGAAIYVIHADSMSGPWSRPVDLGIRGSIDPGHAVGEDGERYLFLSAGFRVKLTRDGLATDGPVEKVYDGWKYPDDWITEAYALEGPKMLRRGDWFYMISAVGGTAGPATGHMVIAARSRSIHGPWQDCPDNPIVRTRSDQEAWWSRGHATLVEGPAGDWWMVYHGIENGYRTLGRQCLLEPVEWTADGWPRALGGDLSRPLASPRGGTSQPHGLPRSDDFAHSALGSRWVFDAPSRNEAQRASFGPDGLLLTAKGTGPQDASPLTNTVGDRSYIVTSELALDGAATGGMLLYLSNRLFLGMAIDGRRMITYGGGRTHHWREAVPPCDRIWLRIENRDHIVTMHYSLDGSEWTRHGLRFESSGYNLNTSMPGDGENLRPAIFAAGTGAVRFRDFLYRAL